MISIFLQIFFCAAEIDDTYSITNRLNFCQISLQWTLDVGSEHIVWFNIQMEEAQRVNVSERFRHLNTSL